MGMGSLLFNFRKTGQGHKHFIDNKRLKKKNCINFFLKQIFQHDYSPDYDNGATERPFIGRVRLGRAGTILIN